MLQRSDCGYAESRLIVAAEVTQSAADVEQLLPMVEQTCAVTQGVPSEILADAGYRSEANLQGLEGKKIDGYISLGRERKSPSVVNNPEKPATSRMQEKLATEKGRKTYSLARDWSSRSTVGSNRSLASANLVSEVWRKWQESGR